MRFSARCLGFLFLIVAPLSQLHADDFEWTGGGGDSDWNNPANWTNITAGGSDADGIPDADDRAEFPLDAIAQGGSASELVIPANIRLTVAGNSFSSVEVRNRIINAGEITFEEDNLNNNGGVVDQRLIIDSDVTLDGGGTIRFNGSQAGIDSDTNNGTLTNVDNTIRGNGTIRDITLNNDGTLIAENGVLLLQNVIVNNNGGRIELLADGELETTESQISGGVLRGSTGSLFRGDTFGDLTTSGILTLGGGVSGLSRAELKGTITNTGEITFEEDNVNNNGAFVDQRLIIDSDVTLDGGGTVRFNGSQTGIDSDTNSGTLTNVDNTIRGNGTIRDITLNNEGVLLAEDGTFRLQDVILNNDSGNLEAAGDGLLEVSRTLIDGGTFETTGNGIARLNEGTRAASTIFRGANTELADAVLEDSQNQGTLRIGGGAFGLSRAELKDTITNTGEITFEEDNVNNNGAFVDQRLIIDSDVTLDGGGTIRFNGSQTGIDSDTNNGTLTNVDNTIRGNGTIRDITLNNEGTLISENGMLLLQNAVVNNSGGRIEVSADGELETTESQISGGILRGSTGSLFRGDTFGDLTTTGVLMLGGGVSGLSRAELKGTITNTGEITFEEDNVNNNGAFVDQRLIIDSDVTVDGGGTVRFNGSQTGIDSDTNSGTLTNVDNTIRGNGTIRDITFNNEGTLISEDGVLRLQSAIVNNTGGRIEIASDGELETTESQISGGVLRGSTGSLFRGDTFADLTTTGVLTLGGGVSGLSRAELKGTITNTGEITFEEDNVNNNGGFVDQRLIIDSDVTLDGSGTIRLNGSQTGFDSSDAEAMIFNIDNTIRGRGVIDVDLTNEGRIFADSTEGILEINGQLTLAESGTVSVLLGGTEFTDSGVFDVSSLFEANGTFQPVVNSETLFAEIGATYIFLTGNVDANVRFDSIDHSLAGQYRFDLIYTPDSIAVELVDIVAVPEPSSGLLLLAGFAGCCLRRNRKSMQTNLGTV